MPHATPHIGLPPTFHAGPPVIARFVDRPHHSGGPLLRVVEHSGGCHATRERCDDFERTCDPARPLRYDEYLGERNRATLDVRPGLPGPRRRHDDHACRTHHEPRRSLARAHDGPRPSYGWPTLADPMPRTDPVELRREMVAYLMRVFAPAGSLIDVFA